LGFSADWLALREPADRAARHAGLMLAAADAAGPSPVILDLGSGTGATRRAMEPFLPAGTRWRLADHDPALLALAASPDTHAIEADLTELDTLPWDDVTLVTCSALLDLVSSEWIDRLAVILASRQIPFYAALSYDGAMAWDPADHSDATITAAFNRHQRGNKGFGSALGPDASAVSSERLAAAGFATRLASSPWDLSPDASDLQANLLTGIAAAAAEAGAGEAEGWAIRRRGLLSRTRMIVGHTDLLALPPGFRS
jgi:SAM-dependent methyltransferase